MKTTGQKRMEPTGNNTEPMACRRCGVCCTKHQAYVRPEEIRRIIDFLRITAEEWNRQYEDPRWEYSDYRLIRHVDDACAFLRYKDGPAACSIYAVRPACCAEWEPGPGKRECREGMRKSGAVPSSD